MSTNLNRATTSFMKAYKLCVLFCLSSMGSIAQRSCPPLLVPYFKTFIPVLEGKIFLPAYNVNIMKMWPEDLHLYKTIVRGGNRTVINLRKKNLAQQITLDQAIHNGYVTVFSISAAAYGRNPGLVVEPVEGVSLIGLQTEGFIITDSLDMVADSLVNDTSQYKIPEAGYDLNSMHLHTYLLTQQIIWKSIYKKPVANSNELNKLTQLFVQNILSNSHPTHYKESVAKGTVYILAGELSYDPARPSANYYDDNGQHFFMIKEIIDGFKQLVAYPSKDSFSVVVRFSPSKNQLDSIVIEGRWRGIIPMRICFISEQKTKLTAILKESQPILSSNAHYAASLILSYDFGENPGVCKMKFPDILNYPGDGKDIILDACKISIRVNVSDLVIDL